MDSVKCAWDRLYYGEMRMEWFTAPLHLVNGVVAKHWHRLSMEQVESPGGGQELCGCGPEG